MKVLFISNYINGHQTEFCSCMHNTQTVEFIFLQTEQMDEERVKLGWKLDAKSFPYLVEYKDDKNSKDLIENADVIILGDTKIDILKYSLKKEVLILFYRERLFKKKSKLELLRYIKVWIKYAYKFRKYETFVLCASAYAAADFKKSKSFLGKYYKWGYFPEFLEYNIEKLLDDKAKNSSINILWVGRMIDWKRCEDVLKVSQKLKENKIDFRLDIVGTGYLEQDLKQYAQENGLSDCVVFHGSCPQKEVRTFMEKANIFITTSNHEEGWGAVVNEAMNSGCAVIGSHAVGSVPFLIEHRKNGLIYKCGDIDNLYKTIKICIDDPDFTKELGSNAYSTIKDIWNAENASKQLVNLIENIKKPEIKEGPCSKAYILKDDWFKGE